MGGNKDGKGDRTYSQRSGGSGGGGGSVSEAGALFPRLHVKETKRVGPRAPPRNKMALYEQFTFPSSRFVPPSIPLRSTARPAPTPVTTTAYGPQRPSLESSMFYGLSPSFGAMPWMPYTAMSNTSNPGGQPSLNGSSGSTIVDGEGDLRHRRGAPAADCARPASSLGGQGTVWAPSQSNFSGVSRKRSRLDDYCSVPTATAKGAGSREAAGDAVGSDKTMWQPWQQRKVETANNSVRMSVSSDCQVESSGLESLRTNRGANSVSEVARDDEGANKDIIWKGDERHHDGEESEVQKCDTIQEGKNRTHGRKTKFCDADGNVIHRGRQVNHEEKKSLQADFDVASKAPKNRTTDNGDSVKALGNGDQDSSQRRKIISTEGGSSTPSRDPAKGSMEKEDVTARSKGAERESRKRANPSECKSSSFVEADDELETISGVEVSGHSDSEACSDGEESDSSISDPQTPRKMRKLSSRNVVKLLGEQEFWRTRDLLQRQQKIFSEQLFEMHRLIKVQQMLAMAADEVMDEETLGGIGEMPEETLDPDYADEQDVEEDGAEETALVKGGREARVGVSHENEGDNAEKQPDTCQSSTSHRARGQPPGADPAPELDKAEVSPLPSVGPGESTASWGYPMGPKADVNNWFGAAIPAPSGAFMYQPYPGAFHPPQGHAIATYNSPYGPIVCAPGPMDVSSMPPYAMPRYEQRLDMIPDMYRYNSYQQQWPPAMLCPPVPSNPGAGWYGVPPPMPYLDPALSGSCGWYEDMAPGPAHPSGSSSYIRPPPAHASTAHGIPVPRPATFFMQPSPWADVSHQSSADGEEFRNQQVPWTGVKEAGGQTSSLASQRRATNLSGAEGVTPESPRDGGGVQQSVSRPSSHDTIGNQSAGKGIGYCWGLTASGNDFHDRESNVAEASVRTQSISKDKEEERKQKKSRLESRQDLARETLETDEGRQRVECTDPTESQRDALPLFPLGPVLNTPENRRLASQSSGVIKVVPRAMVATAESAAEILLSIQKQRQL